MMTCMSLYFCFLRETLLRLFIANKFPYFFIALLFGHQKEGNLRFRKSIFGENTCFKALHVNVLLGRFQKSIIMVKVISYSIQPLVFILMFVVHSFSIISFEALLLNTYISKYSSINLIYRSPLHSLFVCFYNLSQMQVLCNIHTLIPKIMFYTYNIIFLLLCCVSKFANIIN